MELSVANGRDEAAMTGRFGLNSGYGSYKVRVEPSFCVDMRMIR